MLTALLRSHEELAHRLSMLAIEPARAVMGSADLIAPPRTKNYALVGTAFDYMLRIETERRNHKAKDREWVASIAIGMPMFHELPVKLQGLYKAVVKEAMQVHDDWLMHDEGRPGSILAGRMLTESSRPMVERLAKVCLCLAKIDPLFRSGTVYEDVNQYETGDLEDMYRLFQVAPWELIGGDPNSTPLLNPEFGNVSRLFRGADADIIVDDVLIDYKTVLGFSLDKYLPQLMGYFCCSERYRETEDPTFPVLNHAGIYFARHGKLVTFPLDEVRNHPDFDDASKDLFDTARKSLWPDGFSSIEGIVRATVANELISRQL